MVKNTTGGTGTKSLARKHQSSSNERLRLPECDLEQFACVTKMLGFGMCEIYTNNNTRLIGHIRKAFRERNKRNNMITPQCIVLVGLHEWEKIPKNCDILEIYDQNQVEQLKSFPNINEKYLILLNLFWLKSMSKKVSSLSIWVISNDGYVSKRLFPILNV